MACLVTPDEDTSSSSLFPSAAIALGPKPIPPLKALGAWEASSLNSSSRLQYAASGLRTSLQEARVGGLGTLCACAGQCVSRVTAHVCPKCEPTRVWILKASGLEVPGPQLDGPLVVSACVLCE